MWWLGHVLVGSRGCWVMWWLGHVVVGSRGGWVAWWLGHVVFGWVVHVVGELISFLKTSENNSRV